MAGTKAGGLKAAATNKARYGMQMYHEIGRMGGLKSTGGGFAKNPELAREAGRKGGMMSKRRSKKAKVEKELTCCTEPTYLRSNPFECINCGHSKSWLA